MAALSAAKATSGNDLQTWCSSPNSVDHALCLGYITGVLENRSPDPLGPYGACPPKGLTNGQVVDKVAKYLGDHPDHGRHAADFIAEWALRDAFPCPDNKK
jgi:hypothetical protein